MWQAEWSRTQGRMNALVIGQGGRAPDPGTVLEQAYYSRFGPTILYVLETKSIQVELVGTTATGRRSSDGRSAESSTRRTGLIPAEAQKKRAMLLMDFGTGLGVEARSLAEKKRFKEIYAVDSLAWKIASGVDTPKTKVNFRAKTCWHSRPTSRGARTTWRVSSTLFSSGTRCAGSTRRGTLLKAAYQLLKPGGVVCGSSWIMTRISDHRALSAADGRDSVSGPRDEGRIRDSAAGPEVRARAGPRLRRPVQGHARVLRRARKACEGGRVAQAEILRRGRPSW